MKYSVQIKPLDEVVYVDEGQTILDAALRAGINLPYSCGRGLCSSCKASVLQGEVDFGSASQFALMDFEKDEGQCLTCCASPLSDVVIEADIGDEIDAIRYVVKDYEGVVTKIENLSEGVKSFFIVLLNEGISFQAGQYVNVKIPGLKGEKRAFSIASPPAEKKIIELNVALVDGGEGTQYFHNNVEVGDVLTFSGPCGNFFVRKSVPGPILFMACGSGLSGPKSMIMDLLETHDERSITLFYEARTPNELHYDSLFKQLEKDHKNFKYVPSIISPQKDIQWQGRYGSVEQVASDCLNGKFEGYTAYISGLPSMIDKCVTQLVKGRCFGKSIFVEHYFNKANNHYRVSSPLFKNL